MSELTTTSDSSKGGTTQQQQQQRSLSRQIVLEEDEYTEALSRIIARDFFPSLVHLDATNNYLDALRSEDPLLLDSTVRRLQELATPGSGRRYQPQQTPSQTPWAIGPSETPLRAPFTNSDGLDGGGDGERPHKKPRYDVNMSLDAFQARYTSEDNSSFTRILEEENERRRERYGWAWDAQKRVEEMRGRMVEGRERMLVEAAPGVGVKGRFVIEAPRPVGLITQGEGGEDKDKEGDEVKEKDGDGNGSEEGVGKREKALALVSKSSGEDGAKGVVDVMARKKDTRPAGVDGWNFKTRNNLMFPPGADVSPYDPSSFTSRGDSKIIRYENTRFPEQNVSVTGPTPSEPPSPTRSRIDAAIAGTIYQPKSPTRNGFPLLPSMPSPTPSELGPAAVKQLMTWGTLNATPRILSTSDDPADNLPPPSTPFHIPAPSARERIGHKLSNKASRSLRERAALLGGGRRGVSSGLGLRTPSSSGSGSTMRPPNWTPSRRADPGSLTPAAKRLLDRTVGVASARRADAVGGGGGAKAKEERDLNKVRWTPSPAPVSRRG